MAQLFKNNVFGVLQSGISNSALSMTLTDASSFPAPTGGDYYLVTLVGFGGNGAENAWEIVKVTAKASNTLTIVRAQEGTTAASWPAATQAQMRLTAGSLSTKADINSPTFTGTVAGVTKAMVGLGNVDNTSDASKPISTATQTALDAKQPIDADLTAIAALTGTTGLLKKTDANTWVLDTTSYSTLALGTSAGAALAASGAAGSATTAAKSDHVHPLPTAASVGAEPAITKSTGYARWTGSAWSFLNETYVQTNAIGVSVQGYDADLAAIGALAGTTGLLRKTAANTWSLDTTTYSTLALGSTAGAALGTAAAGSASTAARSDHVHAMPTAANVGAEPTVTAGTSAQFWRGDKSWTDFATTVRAAVMTGLSTATNTVVAATDTLLVAIGKLQAQVSAKLDTSGGTASGLILNDGYTEEVFAVSGTTPAISPNNGSIQTWTLTGNSTPTSGTWNPGQSIVLRVDDGTGFTVNWSSIAVVWEVDSGLAPQLKTIGFTPIVLTKVGTTIYGRY